MAETTRRPARDASVATDRQAAAMRAVVYSEYGGPEVLRVTDVRTPEPADDEVSIRVVAASVGAGDWHLMRGTPFLVRLVYGGYLKPSLSVLGVDVAGRIDAVGRGVTDFRPGEAVVADLSEHGFGGFAEYVCVPASAVVRKPAAVSFEAAAAVPTSGVAALQALRDVGRLQAGERVLVNGASGGVGTFAVQIARALGAEVTAVCSTAKMDTVRSIGADRVVDYRTTDITALGERYDLVVDTAGSHSLAAYRRLLTPTGRYVMVGGPTRRFVAALVLGPVLSALGKRTYGGFTLAPDPDDLRYLLELVASGEVTPVVGRRYPLRRVPDAIRYLEAGDATGKVVIDSA